MNEQIGLMADSHPILLVRYDAMVHAIAECHRVDEVTEIHNKALAVEVYARQAQNREAERQAAQIRIRALRKGGELLSELDRKPGARTDLTSADDAPRSEYAETIERAGVSRDKAKRWQQVAEIPKEQFEADLEAPGVPTTNGIPERARRSTDPANMCELKRPEVSAEALYLWGRLQEFEELGFFGLKLDLLLDELPPDMRADCERILPLLLRWLRALPAEQRCSA